MNQVFVRLSLWTSMNHICIRNQSECQYVYITDWFNSLYESALQNNIDASAAAYFKL